MIEVFRIVKKKHTNTAFNGEGAGLYPGRWNHAGIPVVYTAASLSLAALELFVHLEALPPIQYASISAHIPKSIIMYEPDKLPFEWDRYPHSQATQDLGNSWVENKVSAVLKIPSVIIPSEFNYILNPSHSDFKKIELTEHKIFSFDSRMWKK